MGIYDMVERIQVKCVSNPSMQIYNQWDAIDLKDGAYIGYEGIFVVKNGFIENITYEVFDKWGNELDCKELIEKNSEVSQLTKEIIQKEKIS